MARLLVSLLGPFQVTLDGKPVTAFESAKVRALLAYLAAEARQAHSRQALAELLWPERPQGAALADLRHALANLRKAIADASARPPFLLINQTTLQFNLASDATVDVADFVMLLNDGQGLTPQNAEAALALQRGPFLDGFRLSRSPQFEEWMVVTAEQVAQLAQQASARLADGCEARGDFAQATDWTRRQLALEPWNEEVHQRLIRQLAQSGQRSAALHQYETCRRMLANELGVEPQPATQALVAAIRNGEDVLDPQIALTVSSPGVDSPRDLHKVHLPAQSSAFFGRAAELEQVAARLADPACRLLTVLGPGGMGKSRLAIQAAGDLGEHFADGVWFVDLAPVNAPDQIAGAILRVFGLPPTSPDTATARLLEHLDRRQALLVLDHFEHLLDGADLLPMLLQARPALKLLVTSRVRLYLAEEWLLPLDGLATPPPDLSNCEEEDLTDFASIRLFLQQVRRLDPSYAPTLAELRQIGKICRLLEGMPLAIELAAAWVRSLSLMAITEAVHSRLDLFATSLCDVPARHRSMFALFDHSWRLLDDRQRNLLRQLALFRGGCTLAAATAVAGATPADMEALVDTSWLRVRDRRFYLHELMRQYCLARLDQEHETKTREPVEEVRRRHCAFFADMARSEEQALNWQREPMAMLSADFGNLETAWHWALAHGEFTATRQMMNGLFYVAELTGWYGAVLPYFENAASALRTRLQQTGDGADPGQGIALLLINILYIEKVLLSQLGWLRRVRACVDEARALLKIAEHDMRWQGQELHVRLAAILLDFDLGNFAAAHAAARELLAFLQTHDFACFPWRAEIGTRFWQMHVHHTLGTSARFLGDYATAQAHDEAAIDLCDEMGERRLKAHHIRELAALLRLRGEYLQAEALIQSALTLSRSFEDRVSAAFGELSLAQIKLDTDRHMSARERCRHCLAVAMETGQHALHVRSLTALARCERLSGNLAAARARLEEARIACIQPEIPHSNHLAAVFLELGHVACARQEWAQARQCYTNTLAAKGRSAAEAQEALAGLAEVAWAEQDAERAMQLLGQVIADGATADATRQRAEKLLAHWRLVSSLPTQQDKVDVANVACAKLNIVAKP